MTDPGLRVIFSDLDGTFLDDRYAPVLDAASFAAVAARWRVIWASSRTSGEIAPIQRALNHGDDVIAENGAVCRTANERVARALGDAHLVDGAWVARLAAPRAAVRAQVAAAFEDAGAVVPPLDHRAEGRVASVVLAPGDVAGERAGRALDALRADGCSVVYGGRWISVVHGADKGATARAWLGATTGAAQPPADVVAIGNADNDESLLRFAARAFVVRASDGGYPPRLASLTNARYLQRYGPAGWCEMLEHLDAGSRNGGVGTR